MTWQQVAEFDTEADIGQFEEGERVSTALERDDMRVVDNVGENQCYLERESEDGSGWARVAFIEPEEGEPYDWGCDIGHFGDDYRCVHVYGEDNFAIERYYE